MTDWNQELKLPDLEKQYGLPSGLLGSVMSAESAGNPKAVSPAGAQGLFQFMPDTAKAYGVNPLDPQSAALGAARMYGDLSKQYKGDVPSMLAAYNWGSGNLNKNGLQNAPAETKNYIQKVQGQLGTQVADAGNVATDAQVDGTINVEMPDGTVITGVPAGTTKEQLQAKIDAKAPVKGIDAPQPFTEKYKENVGSYLGDIPKQFTNPYEQDTSAGPEWLKRIGDVGGRIGSGALDLIGAGVVSPISSGIETQITQPIARQFIDKNTSKATKQDLANVAHDTADLGAQALLAPSPMKAAKAVGELPVAAGKVAEIINELKPPPEQPSPAGTPLRQQNLMISKQARGTADDILKTALEDEGLKASDIAAALEDSKQTGLPVVALDVATKDSGGVMTQGRNLNYLADAAGARPGKPSAFAGDVAARGYQASNRIGQAFDKAISGNDYAVTGEQLTKAMKDSGMAYELAYKSPKAIDSPLIQDLLSRPAGQEALANAEKLAQNSGAVIKNQDGSLSTRGVDYVKRALDDMYEKQGKTQFGKTTEEGRAIQGIKSALLKEADALNPTYAVARKQFSDPATLANALEDGRKFRSMDPEEIKGFFKTKSAPEKAAFAQGVRRDLQDLIDSKADGANPISSIWKQSLRDKLKPIVGGKFDEFAKMMEHEQAMQRTNNALARSSPTASRQQFNELIDKKSSGVGGIVNAITHPTGTAIDAGLGLVNKSLQKSAKTMSHDTASYIMQHLTSSDPEFWHALSRRIGEKSARPLPTVQQPAKPYGAKLKRFKP